MNKKKSNNRDKIYYSFCIATKNRKKSLLKRIDEISEVAHLIKKRVEIVILDSSNEYIDIKKLEKEISEYITIKYIRKDISLYEAYKESIYSSSGDIIKTLSDDDQILSEKMAFFL